MARPSPIAAPAWISSRSLGSAMNQTAVPTATPAMNEATEAAGDAPTVFDGCAFRSSDLPRELRITLWRVHAP